MRTIKINFEGFWPGFDYNNNFIINTLKKYYEVQITPNPDYLFYSTYNDKALKYDCVKISFTGENISPDFNVCDYAMGFDYIQFEDRYLRFPLWLLYDQYFEKKTVDGVETTCLKKIANDGHREDFASFVCSNGNGDSFRTDLFEELGKYKKVDSGGRFRNNVGGPVKSKTEFEAKHRFSISCENASQSGYTTEKLVEGFVVGCVPIYWGDPRVTEVFNPKAFVNCMEFENVSEAAKAVLELENGGTYHGLTYSDMCNEEVFNDSRYIDKQFATLDKFLCTMVELPLEKAKKNARVYWKTIYARKLKQGTVIFRTIEKVRKLILRK